jgi:ABC-type molybdate transport system substrate-binding protein
MTIRLMRPSTLLMLALVLIAAPAAAAEIKVLAYGAITIPARELAAFEKETGHRVTFTFGCSPTSASPMRSRTGSSLRPTVRT